ncbi:hypothetical protein DRQ36_03750 [bacterium]|nr:MAG: hypothetical protein DRQ36_03750 [bacterium]
MKITCPNCGSSSQIPDEKLPEKPVQIRCKSCGTAFTIQRPPATKPVLLVNIEKLPGGKIRVVCPKCQAEYIVETTKLPEGKVKTTCKKCGQVFAFTAKPRKDTLSTPLPPPSTPSSDFLKPTVEPPLPARKSPESSTPVSDDSDEQQMPVPMWEKPAIDPQIPPGTPVPPGAGSRPAPPVVIGTGLKDSPQTDHGGAEPPKTVSEEFYPPGTEFIDGQPVTGKANFFIIDKNGKRDGPVTLTLLRDWVKTGQVREEDTIELPDGTQKPAGKMIELETAFAAVKGTTLVSEPVQVKPTAKEFFSGVGAGAIGGLGCGIPATAFNLMFGMGVIAITCGASGSFVLALVLIGVLIWVGIGTFLGTLLSTIHALSLSSDSDIYIWNAKSVGAIGGGLGLFLGLLSFLSRGGLLSIPLLIIEGYLLSRVILAIYIGLFHSSPEG